MPTLAAYHRQLILALALSLPGNPSSSAGSVQLATYTAGGIQTSVGHSPTGWMGPLRRLAFLCSAIVYIPGFKDVSFFISEQLRQYCLKASNIKEHPHRWLIKYTV
ncbi:hypothetical protein OBBRIDRAFT_571819 [Obba rivulosa]|uniref:Secreted protein n=1 Tax=Obba rivulosa TaxID=1052685 RepID=A0A8E2DNP7_9APHY|nr:hypothetical protein OBBRIDRAFT_571819 [Obba rivulosa]